MTTQYPNQIDGSEELPLQVDGTSIILAATINNLRDALIAVETELGIEPSGTFNNVKGRLDLLESLLEATSFDQASNVSLIDADGYYVSTNAEGALQEIGASISSIPAPEAINVSLDDVGGYYASNNVEGALAELGVLIPVSASSTPISDLDGYYVSGNVEGALIEASHLKTDVISFHIETPADGYYGIVRNMPFAVEIIEFNTKSDSGTADGYLIIQGARDISSFTNISSVASTISLSSALIEGGTLQLEILNNISLDNFRSTISYKRT